MQKYRVRNQEEIAGWPEIAMAVHFGEGEDDNKVYAIIGCQLAVRLDELLNPENWPEPMPPAAQLDQWLSSEEIRPKRFRQLSPEDIARALYYALSPAGA